MLPAGITRERTADVYVLFFSSLNHNRRDGFFASSPQKSIVPVLEHETIVKSAARHTSRALNTLENLANIIQLNGSVLINCQFKTLPTAENLSQVG